MPKRPVNRPFWTVKAAAKGVGEVFIYGDIVSEKWFDTDVTAADFAKALKELGDVGTLNIYINSYGGDVFQGQAIHSILKRHAAEKHVYIDGIAASAASVIAVAGDVVHIPKNGMVMVHRAWTWEVGNADDFRKMAEVMDQIDKSLVAAYMSKLEGKTDESKLWDLMTEETWMTAEEAVACGFADELVDAKQVAACASPEWRDRYLQAYKNMPDAAKAALRGSIEAAQPGSPTGELADADSLRRRRLLSEAALTLTTLDPSK